MFQRLRSTPEPVNRLGTERERKKSPQRAKLRRRNWRKLSYVVIKGMEGVRPRTDPQLQKPWSFTTEINLYFTALYQNYLEIESLKSLKLNWILRCCHQGTTATLQVSFPDKGVPYLKILPFLLFSQIFFLSVSITLSAANSLHLGSYQYLQCKQKKIKGSHFYSNFVLYFSSGFYLSFCFCSTNQSTCL